MSTPLFDVVISVSGDDETGGGIYEVTIIDRYHPENDVIGRKECMHSLDDAIEFAKGAVTAFMEGTTA
jgi:hypothetical protein